MQEERLHRLRDFTHIAISLLTNADLRHKFRSRIEYLISSNNASLYDTLAKNLISLALCNLPFIDTV